MGVNGENMDKRYQRVTLVLEPTIVATWEQHVQFASRSFLNVFSPLYNYEYFMKHFFINITVHTHVEECIHVNVILSK